MVNRYIQFLLRTTSPTKTWQITRFILHWLTLPVKVIVIGSLGTFQIIRNLFKKQQNVPKLPSLENKKAYFQKVLERLPVWQLDHSKVYVSRVPYYNIPTGDNHNPDHQCLRQGTFIFAMNRLGKYEESMGVGLARHIQTKWLCRGFKLNKYDQEMQFNAGTTSGDMLIGMTLGLSELDRDSNWQVFEKYDHLIANIIEHDYAVLEGSMPDLEDVGRPVWDELYKKVAQCPELVTMKSERGMWQPGAETAGAQALTILCALRLAEKRNGNRDAGEHYKKLLWKYGYGLLSLFPTAYTEKRRGYFNEHNCISALYVLSKFSDNRMGKLFWKIPMVYVWLLSRHWYNGYFSGLLNAAHPGTLNQSYLDKCIAYLYQYEPNTFHNTNGTSIKSNLVPVPYNQLPSDEFSQEVSQDLKSEGGEPVKTGLGFIATAILLEKNPKILL